MSCHDTTITIEIAGIEFDAEVSYWYRPAIIGSRDEEPAPEEWEILGVHIDNVEPCGSVDIGQLGNEFDKAIIKMIKESCDD